MQRGSSIALFLLLAYLFIIGYSHIVKNQISSLAKPVKRKFLNNTKALAKRLDFLLDLSSTFSQS